MVGQHGGIFLIVGQHDVISGHSRDVRSVIPRTAFVFQAAYDAYLTGCCFAAAAVVGLGVGIDELKGMARGGETPACLAPVMNVVPLFRVVSERGYI